MQLGVLRRVIGKVEKGVRRVSVVVVVFEKKFLLQVRFVPRMVANRSERSDRPSPAKGAEYRQ